MADRDLPVPDRVAAPCGSTVAQVQRTIHPGRYSNPCATPGGTPFAIADGEFSNRDQYVQAIRAAREYIYLENQTVSVRPILAELAAAVCRGVAVVLLLPPDPGIATTIGSVTNAARWRVSRNSRWQDWPDGMPAARASPFTSMPSS